MTKTAKLYGKVQPAPGTSEVTASVFFNDTLVYSGPVQQTGEMTQHGLWSVAEWTYDPDQFDQTINLKIEVEGGTVNFSDILTETSAEDHKDTVVDIVFKQDAAWNLYSPINIDELLGDADGPDAAFVEKYSMTKDQAKFNLNFSIARQQSIKFPIKLDKEIYCDPTINRSSTRTIVEFLGDWYILINPGESFVCSVEFQKSV
jgi:hypothetical protein